MVQRHTDTINGRMKAAFLYGPGDLRIGEMEIPRPGEGEVLVRVKAVGICQSDVKVYRGLKSMPYGEDSYGLSGHEWSGEVVAVGEGVKDIAVGDRVVPEIIIPCGRCKSCIEGMTNLCANKGRVLRGYAEYAVSPSRQLLKVPDNVTFEDACLMEPLAVCVRAHEIISPSPGDDVLIIGGGPMGLLHLQLARLSGARVMVSELIEDRLEKAKRMGADVTINPANEDLVARVKELTNGYGADAVIVAAGGKAATESAFDVISNAGTIVLFASSFPSIKIEVDPNLIHYSEMKVTGAYDHLPAHMDKALKLVSLGMLDLRQVVSHILALDDLKQGLEMDDGAKLKVIVKI